MSLMGSSIPRCFEDIQKELPLLVTFHPQQPLFRLFSRATHFYKSLKKRDQFNQERFLKKKKKKQSFYYSWRISILQQPDSTRAIVPSNSWRRYNFDSKKPFNYSLSLSYNHTISQVISPKDSSFDLQKEDMWKWQRSRAPFWIFCMTWIYLNSKRLMSPVSIEFVGGGIRETVSSDSQNCVSV